jgi:UDP-N-acetylmuramoyl-tripeptide--D-alanyl-D-alanine ligase
MTIEALYNHYLLHPGIATDTRKIISGDLFFALKGPNFNGNIFAADALRAGASLAITDEDYGHTDTRMILVPDVLSTLQQLAYYHRKQFDIPFVAITGSNGKTTTKELVNAVLSTTFRVTATKGNLNNHIGIPLTLLSVKKDAAIAIIEMGANHQKEIESYCTYTAPTHGLITNCGKAHLEGFGSEAGVRKGKGELFDYLAANNGTAFIMKDYDYLVEMSSKINKVITYGSSQATITGTITGNEPFLKMNVTANGDTIELNTQLVGAYNFPNVLAAATAGYYFGVSPANIKQAIENYAPGNSRSQLVQHGAAKIILDAYNANPGSMRSAITNFAAIPAQNKILILGAMAELGKDSIAEHEAIVQLISEYTWQAVLLTGGDFLNIKHPYHSAADANVATEWLRQNGYENAYILVKGSRSMEMEKVMRVFGGSEKG